MPKNLVAKNKIRTFALSIMRDIEIVNINH